MRITGGEFSGRVFHPPDVEGFRPTMEKVRQAVLSMLESQIDLTSVAVLDCYSGSGAFGFECLSRGVESCIFIERNPQLIKFITETADKLQVRSKVQIIRGELPGELRKIKGEFGLIFSDPPYDISPGDFMDKLLELKLLQSDGLLILETRKNSKAKPVETQLSLDLLRDKTYGDTRIEIFRYSAE